MNSDRIPDGVRFALCLFAVALAPAAIVECSRLAQIAVRGVEATLIVLTWSASAVAIWGCTRRNFWGCFLVALVTAESILWFRYRGVWLRQESLAMPLMFAFATVLRFVSLIVLAQPRSKAWFKRSVLPSHAPQARAKNRLQVACELCLGLSLTSFTPQSPWGGSYRIGIASGVVGAVLLVVIVIRSKRGKSLEQR